MKDYTIQLQYSSNYAKKERQFIKTLINIYTENQRKGLVLEEKDIANIASIKIEEVPKFLNKLISKMIKFTTSTKTTQEEYCFNMFSYSYFEPAYTFHLNHIFTSTEDIDRNTSEKLFDLFKLEEKSSFILYLFFSNLEQLNTTISINELKTLLNIDENYKRFYDLEKIYVRPLITDINKNTSINIFYDKIRDGHTIDKLNFHIDKKSNITDLINTIFSKFPSPPQNANKIIDIISNLNSSFSNTDILFCINYLINNTSNANLEEIVLDQLTIEKMNLILKPAINISERFVSHLKILPRITELLDSFNLPVYDQNFYPSRFLRDIYKVSYYKPLEVENEYVIVSVKINLVNIINIKIYLK